MKFGRKNALAGPSADTNEMLDAFRYNRRAEVAFAEKCRNFRDFTKHQLV